MEQPIVIARLGKPYGVKGWQRLISFAESPENMRHYFAHLLIQRQGQWQAAHVDDFCYQGKWLIKLADCHSPEQAKQLVHSLLAIARHYLAANEKDEYYWHDLIGMQVYHQQGQWLGEVQTLMRANHQDLLVVVKQKKRQLIPFSKSTVLAVDTSAKKMTVAWEVED